MTELERLAQAYRNELEIDQRRRSRIEELEELIENLKGEKHLLERGDESRRSFEAQRALLEYVKGIPAE